MSKIGVRHRLLLSGLALAGLFVYLVIVDYGINAGRIHHGVRVGTVDVGGLTEREAVDLLAEVGSQMRDTPVVFTAEGLNFNFLPREFGWLPTERPAARRASDVGRTEGLLGALQTRFKAYLGGVTVRWPDQLNTKRVGTRLNALQRQAEALGYTLDRKEMRRRIKRAIWDWPREPYYEIPVTRG